MKRLYFFASYFRTAIVELPLLFMFLLTLIYGKRVPGPMHLYPLQTVLVFMIVFTVVYFFRAVSVDYDEIRAVGFFSSRDRAMIDEGMTLIFTLFPKHKLKIELFGFDGQNAALEWLRDEQPREIYLFRERVRGGKRAIGRALKFFGVPMDAQEKIFSDDAYQGEFESVTVSAKKKEDIREVRLTIKKDPTEV